MKRLFILILFFVSSLVFAKPVVIDTEKTDDGTIVGEQFYSTLDKQEYTWINNMDLFEFLSEFLEGYNITSIEKVYDEEEGNQDAVDYLVEKKSGIVFVAKNAALYVYSFNLDYLYKVKLSKKDKKN